MISCLLLLLFIATSSGLQRLNTGECKIPKGITFDEIFTDCKGMTHIMPQDGLTSNDVTLCIEGKTTEQINELFANLTTLSVSFTIEAAHGETLTFPKLKAVQMYKGGRIYFIKNDELKFVNFSALSSVDLSYDSKKYPYFSFANNPKLKEISLKNLEEFVAENGALNLILNGELKLLELPKIRKFRVKKVSIAANDQLDYVSFENVQDVSIKKYIIRQNENLSKIQFSPNIHQQLTNSVENATFKGNPKLEEGELEKYRKILGNAKEKYIQDYGECIRAKEVEYLSVLNGCKYINGDLNLAYGKVSGETTAKLTKVTGNVYTAELEEDKLLTFLDGTYINGTLRSSLCDFDFKRFLSQFPEKDINCTMRMTTTIETTTSITIVIPTDALTTEAPQRTMEPSTIETTTFSAVQTETSTAERFTSIDSSTSVSSIPSSTAPTSSDILSTEDGISSSSFASTVLQTTMKKVDADGSQDSEDPAEQFDLDSEDQSEATNKLTIIIVSCLLILLLLCGAAGFYFWRKRRNIKNQYKSYRKSKEFVSSPELKTSMRMTVKEPTPAVGQQQSIKRVSERMTPSTTVTSKVI